MPLPEEISLDPFSSLELVFQNIPGVAVSLGIRICCCFAISEPARDADS